MYENLAHEKYTPIEGAVQFTLDRLYAELGGWGIIADRSGISRRYFRHIRTNRKCISESMLDKILQGCDASTTVGAYEWYTVEELVAKGIWKPTDGSTDFTDEEG